MPWHKIPNTDTCYALVCFDEDGAERSDDRDAPGGHFSAKVIEEVRAHPPTDIFMFSHGWKGDVPVMDLAIDKIRGLGWRPRHSSEDAVRLAARSLAQERGTKASARTSAV